VVTVTNVVRHRVHNPTRVLGSHSGGRGGERVVATTRPKVRAAFPKSRLPVCPYKTDTFLIQSQFARTTRVHRGERFARGRGSNRCAHRGRGAGEWQRGGRLEIVFTLKCIKVTRHQYFLILQRSIFTADSSGRNSVFLARRAVLFPLAVRAGVALRAGAFHPAVGAALALRAAAFHLAVGAALALQAVAFQLAVGAALALHAAAFHLPVGAALALRAVAFQLTVGAPDALRTLVFQLAVRTRTARHTTSLLLSMRAPFLSHRVSCTTVSSRFHVRPRATIASSPLFTEALSVAYEAFVGARHESAGARSVVQS